MIRLSAVQHTLVSSLMTGFIILMLLVAGIEVTKGDDHGYIDNLCIVHDATD